MSQRLVNHSPDLKRLRDEGYEVAIRKNYLIVSNIPYVNPNAEIAFGILVSELTIAGEKAGVPTNHVIHFAGEHPCHSNGTLIQQIKHSSVNKALADGVLVNHSFSNKPTGGYSNYYDKVTTYAAILENEAKAIDDNVTSKTFRVVDSDDEDSIFCYPDTNSSRAEINKITDKVKGQRIGIVGLGGTGSYVLDFVAKTPVAEIHLFDGDKFLAHNAFRSPGAPSVEDLNLLSSKVSYFFKIYSRMRKNIIPHDQFIDKSNVNRLYGLDFVFLCLDKGVVKSVIIDWLEKEKIPFVDVGMGLDIVDDSIIGIIRTTTSTETMREHIHSSSRISFDERDDDDIYSKNIQIAELNSLNASMAVIKWKKLNGFYQDLIGEHHTVYSLNDNSLHYEDEA